MADRTRMIDTTGRRPDVAYQASLLEPNPNLPANVHPLAHIAAETARMWLAAAPDGAELVEALRSLRRGKDSVILATLFPEPAASVEAPTGPERPQ